MKKSFLLASLFAAAFAVTSCSSDKETVQEEPLPRENGTNYLAISINLPTTSAASTRGNNDVYDSGLEAEYAIQDASLLIFDTSNQFVEAYKLEADDWGSASTGSVNVTSTKKFVLQVSGNVAAGYKLLAVINNNGLIEAQDNHTLKVNGTTFTGTYAQLQGTEAVTTGLDCGVMKNNGFFMTNAPLANVQGSTDKKPTDVADQVLVPITQVYTTQAAAQEGTADPIYVERGMAKVTVQGSTGDSFENSKIGDTDLAWTVSSWTIDNANPVSYLVRSDEGFVDGDNGYRYLMNNESKKYRTIGSVDVRTSTNSTQGGSTNETFVFRTYFAKSANYDKSTALNRVTGKENFKTTGANNPQYCFENTFSVANQNVDKTTLVQLAIQAKKSEGDGAAANLYTVNGNKALVYEESTIKTEIANAAQAFISGHTSDYVASGSTIDAGDFTVTEIKVNQKNEVTGATLTYTKSSGDAELKSDCFNEGTTTLTADLCASIFGTIATSTGKTYTQYTNGISYYSIRIKHFGDELTPWNDKETPKPASGKVYPDGNADDNYLGRYGVLRNNWYNLSVSTIKQLGDAVPHTDVWPSTPDDDFDTFITFQINVLSWAKRDQKQSL